MKELLKLNQSRRNIIFETTAREMKVTPVVIEKDFWVCVVLDYLLNKSQYKDCFIFKGGTSLSKCYHVIERFSEDLDIVLKWDVLGYNDELVYKDRSKNQNYLFETKMNEKGARFIQNEIKSDLLESLASDIPGLNIKSDDNDPMVLYVEYPHSASNHYINSVVKLEIGPMAAKTPMEHKQVSPYYVNYFDLKDDDKEFDVSVVSIARTFYEKLLILYSETNRPIEKKMPTRYFRHYYDVAMIYQSEYYADIIKQKELFEEVRLFKNKYYRTYWSKIEGCSLSTIRIYPPKHCIRDLRNDYEQMKEMFFGEIPSFEEVLSLIASLEKELRANG